MRDRDVCGVGHDARSHCASCEDNIYRARQMGLGKHSAANSAGRLKEDSKRKGGFGHGGEEYLYSGGNNAKLHFDGEHREA